MGRKQLIHFFDKYLNEDKLESTLGTIIATVFIGGLAVGGICLILDAFIRGWLHKESWELPIWYPYILVVVSIFIALFIFSRITRKR